MSGPGQLPPLMLDIPEMQAVVLGLRYVEEYAGDALAFAAGDALAKIAEMLPSEMLDLLEDGMLPPEELDDWHDLVDPAFLHEAAIGQRKLRIAYRDQQGDPSRRVIWPIALGHLGSAPVVAAWCELRRDWRTFRIDRIEAAEATGECYDGQRDDLLESYRRHLGGSSSIRFDDGNR